MVYDGICKECGQQAEIHAKGCCYRCYKTKHWKPKRIICKRCGRERNHHGKGYCNACFNFLFHYDKIKAFNYRKWHNVDLETYNRITKECVVCGFNKLVSLHHLDGDKRNSSDKNLIGLCPNHHGMIHHYEFYKEVKDILAEKGYDVSQVRPTSLKIQD